MAGSFPESHAVGGNDSSYPTRALVGGVVREQTGVIAHAAGGPDAVTFEDEDGTTRYVIAAEWLKGAIALVERGAAVRQGDQQAEAMTTATTTPGQKQEQAFSAAMPNSSALVARASKDTAKVALFRSLFVGRPDVYALGYVDRRKADSHGGPLPRLSYGPVCGNRWKPGICPRAGGKGRSVRCADCESRDLVPLSDEAIKSHLMGKDPKFRDVIASYPINAEGNVHFLVADFDGAGWKGEVAAYRAAAYKLGVPVACEVSRSGNGGHLWTFFREPVPAHLARNLGSCVITKALSDGGLTSFSAYDRLFPTQDSVPKGGFGNAVALPLQGQALKVGTTVFVDDSFHPYDDQWAFLSQMGRMGLREVEHAVAAAGVRPLGTLAPADDDSAKGPDQSRQTATLPGIAQPGHRGKAFTLTSADFPPILHVTKDGLLRVSRDGLSAQATDQIHRLAAFANPAFYRAQAMHQNVFRIPRVIDCGELTSELISLPRGCEDRLVSLCDEIGVHVAFDDQRAQPEPIEVAFKGTLRPHQQEAASALLAHETGVLSAPTAFGKTVVCASLIASLRARTLVVVPSRALLDQWHDRLLQFLDLSTRPPVRLTKSGRPSKWQPSPVGMLGGGRDCPTGIVDVATFQSLVEQDEDGERRAKDLVASYDLVICDECHHVAAPSLEIVMRAVKAHHVYGLSATPTRPDGLQRLVFMQCGPIRYTLSPKQQAVEQGFRRVLVTRFTSANMGEEGARASFNAILDHLCQSEDRNRLVVADALHVMGEGRTPVILTRRKAHVVSLAGLLRERGVRVIELMGGGGERARRQALRSVHEVPEGESFAVVATGSYVGEGFDEARLDTLLLAAPVSAEQVLAQYTGRIQREREGRAAAVVYDYADVGIPMLDGMYRKRLRAYARLGYELREAESGAVAGDGLLVGGDVDAGLASDLAQATRSVLVCASWASVGRTREVARRLAGCVGRGLEVSVIIARSSSGRGEERTKRCVSLLEKAGCSVRMTEGRLPDFVVVDGEVVWYGSASPLASAKEGDCCLRTTSREVAASLARAGWGGC